MRNTKLYFIIAVAVTLLCGCNAAVKETTVLAENGGVRALVIKSPATKKMAAYLVKKGLLPAERLAMEGAVISAEGRSIVPAAEKYTVFNYGKKVPVKPTGRITKPLNGIIVPGSEYMLNKRTMVMKVIPGIDEIKRLNGTGVKFVINSNLCEQQKAIKQFRIIIVGSGDVGKMQELYGLDKDRAAALMQRINTFATGSNAAIAGDKAALEHTLAECRRGNIEPILIFHNDGNKLFGRPVAEFHVNNMLTCNSYELGEDQFFRSVDYISIDHVMKSISSIKKCANLNGFYEQFTGNYARALAVDKGIRATIVISGTGITGGGVRYIMYHKNPVITKTIKLSNA